MIFVLDNYDSFTYNLVHMLRELEPEVTVRRNREATVEEARFISLMFCSIGSNVSMERIMSSILPVSISAFSA